MNTNVQTLIADCKNPELFREDILTKLFAFEKELREKYNEVCKPSRENITLVEALLKEILGVE